MEGKSVGVPYLEGFLSVSDNKELFVDDCDLTDSLSLRFNFFMQSHGPQIQCEQLINVRQK